MLRGSPWLQSLTLRAKGYVGAIEVGSIPTRLLHFPYATRYFQRMPFVFCLGLLYPLSFLPRAMKPNRGEETHREVLALVTGLTAWLFVGLFLFSLHKYPNPRYSLIIFPPLFILAALNLLDLRGRGGRPEAAPRRSGIPVFVGVTIFVLLLLNEIVSSAYMHRESLPAPLIGCLEALGPAFLPYVTGYKVGLLLTISACAGGLATLGRWILLRLTGRQVLIGRSGRILAPALLGASVILNLSCFADSMRERRYSLYRASQEAGALLPPESVIAEQFAHAITVENRLARRRILIEKRSATPYDPLLRENGVTHLCYAYYRDGIRVRPLYDPKGEKLRLTAILHIRKSRVLLCRIAETEVRVPPSPYERARECLRAGNRKGAERLLLALRRTHPRNSIMAAALGGLFLQKRAWEEAEKCFREAQRANPSSFQAVLALGYLRALHGQYGKALPFFEDCLDIYREDENLKDFVTAFRRALERGDTAELRKLTETRCALLLKDALR
jgi:tetratricopeptide (TPR) repeat protein